MDEPGPPHDHKTLNAFNEQIAAAQTRIADLEQRIRVIDIELASWKVAPPRTPPISGVSVALGWGAFLGGCTVTALLGRLIAWVIGR